MLPPNIFRRIGQSKVLLPQVQSLYAEGKYIEALHTIEEFQPAPTDNLYQMKVLVLKRLGRESDARSAAEIYVQAIGDARHRVFEETAAVLGRYAVERNDYEEVNIWFTKAIELCKDNKQRNKYNNELVNAMAARFAGGETSGGAAKEVTSTSKGKRRAKSKAKRKGDSTTHLVQDQLSKDSEQISHEDQDEQPPIEKRLQPVKLSSRFDIEFINMTEKDKNDVCLGVWKNSYFQLNRSFIKSKKEQSESLQTLQSLREDYKINEYILRVDFIDYFAPFESKMLICESVVPLKIFLEEKCKAFGDSNDKRDWWKFIAPSFKKIFRDVIRGMRILLSSRKVCVGGTFQECIYVKTHDDSVQGKILPSLDPNANQESDLNALRNMMKFMIGFRFNERDINPLEYGLSVDIQHFLSFVSTQKLVFVDVVWLLDHPWTWNSEECYEFVHKLKDAIKRNVIDQGDFNLELIPTASDTYGDFWNITWPDRISVGVFKDIYNKAGSHNIARYRNVVDIYRFMCACFMHVNDNEYKSPGRKDYLIAEVEEHLRSFFPNIYIDLFTGLYHYAQHYPTLTKEGLLQLCTRI